MDIAEDYTGVHKSTGRLILLSFCGWLNLVYGPTYSSVWTQEVIRKEMDKNAKRGFGRMLGNIDCTH